MYVDLYEPQDFYPPDIADEKIAEIDKWLKSTEPRKLERVSIEADQLDVFLKETVLTLEVAVTETTRQNDSVRREKFEGTVVHTSTISEDSERIKERTDDHWLISWNLSVPISILLK